MRRNNNWPYTFSTGIRPSFLQFRRWPFPTHIRTHTHEHPYMFVWYNPPIIIGIRAQLERHRELQHHYHHMVVVWATWLISHTYKAQRSVCRNNWIIRPIGDGGSGNGSVKGCFSRDESAVHIIHCTMYVYV